MAATLTPSLSTMGETPPIRVLSMGAMEDFIHEHDEEAAASGQVRAR